LIIKNILPWEGPLEDKEIKEHAEQLIFLIPAISRVFQIGSPQEILDMDLTLLELCVVRELSCHKELGMSEVGKALSVNLRTLTRIVDKLVKKDLVVRKPNPDDRRVVRISLTPKGNRASYMLEQEKRKRVEAFLRRMTFDERRTLLNIVKTVYGRIYGREGR